MRRDGPWSGSPQVRRVALADFAADLDRLDVERFGPAGLVVTYSDVAELLAVLAQLAGSLTATIHADPDDPAERPRPATGRPARPLAGRLIMNGWPTGVAVCWAMHHGGPWPATTSAAHTSVGGDGRASLAGPDRLPELARRAAAGALQAANPLGLAPADPSPVRDATTSQIATEQRRTAKSREPSRSAAEPVCTASADVPVTTVPTGKVNDHQVSENGKAGRAVRAVIAAATASQPARITHTGSP